MVSRRIALACAILAALCLLIVGSGCGGGASLQGNPVASSSGVAGATNGLTTADVQAIVTQSAQSVNVPLMIAVTDRSGNILAVYRKAGAPATAIGNFDQMVDSRELAVALARTGSFFSNDQAPLSSRTVRFISGVHFPPGINDAPNAALYGIENTNRGCPLNVNFLPGQTLPAARSINGAANGLGVITGKPDLLDSDSTAVNPGGVPLFRNGRLVGGVGVAGASPDIAEFAAFTGAIGAGFVPTPAAPGVVVIDGVALPFVNQTTRPAGLSAGMADGAFDVGPMASPGPVPEGDLVARVAGPLGGLTQQEVSSIIDQAIATADVTRAVIRLPNGQRARFAVAIADLDGRIIALYRQSDSTVFSVDVAVAKARNLVYMSSMTVDPRDLPGLVRGTAVTNRTISFGAQPFYPPGINASTPGPFFDVFQYDIANPCTNGHQPTNANQNGVVFFPGSVPLYKNGKLVGALGVSGDGVEQDDYVSGQAGIGFEPPDAMRADNFMIRDVRLPYLKFPRNPIF
jgi:uncharacterized protein GlcG (DUF336 family)